MEIKRKYSKHYEESTVINATPENIFSFANDHNNFSSHMNKSSWMMGGGKMETQVDDGKGQKVDSHIRMHGNVFGLTLFLDEIVIKHEPPYRKEWQTIGKINLLVIDHYNLGFEIEPKDSNSRLRVYIDYNLPQSDGTYLLGYLLGGMYAKWCVHQMIYGVKEHFKV